MSMDQYTEKISLWLDNELSPGEVTELEAHLADCPACHQTYEAMQRVDRLFRTAARQIVIPAPGFTRRFETRLAQQRPVKPWQLWLTLGALLSGTVLIFSAYAIVGGIALLGVRTTAVDAGLYYQGVITFLESVDQARIYLNLSSLFVKASLLTMSQPLFWVSTMIIITIIGLWLRIWRGLSQGRSINLSLSL
jgi:predicted anti-sigma-YlaC factor YlaD